MENDEFVKNYIGKLEQQSRAMATHLYELGEFLFLIQYIYNLNLDLTPDECMSIMETMKNGINQEEFKQILKVTPGF